MCEFTEELLKCTTLNLRLIEQSRKSFPSGHTSLTFSSYTILSLYILFHLKPKSASQRIVSIGVPIGIGCFVGASRIVDNWHHVSDVLGGAVIGLGCGGVCFFCFYLEKEEEKEIE